MPFVFDFDVSIATKFPEAFCGDMLGKGDGRIQYQSRATRSADVRNGMGATTAGRHGQATETLKFP